MFETVELGQVCAKSVYDAEVPLLRTRLLRAQAALANAGFPVIVLINGVDGSGKRETTDLLQEWLDSRFLVSEVYAEPTEEERERPEFWRFFSWLPPKGKIGLFLGNWYTRPILERVAKKLSSSRFERDLTRLQRFERLLTDDGALVIKLWLHMSKRDQRRRLERLEKDRDTRYRVTRTDWKQHEKYDDYLPVCERVVRETSSDDAPWILIEATDSRHRNLAVAREIVTRLEARLAAPPPPREHHAEPPRDDPKTILDLIDLTETVSKPEYDEEMPRLQAKLNRLAQELQKDRRSAILVFEGGDAAGKGGAIRRVTASLNSGQYRVIPIAAPTEEERAHHYLWRFYRHLPRRGKLTIYDRSWYGRVLVERVEGFASPAEWARAYEEINEFERELVESGIVLVKFWLHVSPEEQLARFQQREQDPWKQHKITPEDYRNREKRNQYEEAAADMIARCSSEHAPFALISAEDKRHARIAVLRKICERFKASL